MEQLKQSSQAPVKHGACLALGMAALGSARADVYNELKNALDADDAVVGEAAATSAGLVMLGITIIPAPRLPLYSCLIRNAGPIKLVTTL